MIYVCIKTLPRKTVHLCCIKENEFAVNGVWSNWESWGACDPNTGMKERAQVCSNPANRNGGASCAGSGQESTKCPGMFLRVSTLQYLSYRKYCLQLMEVGVLGVVGVPVPVSL